MSRALTEDSTRTGDSRLRRILAFAPIRIVIGIAMFAALLLPVQVAVGQASSVSVAGAAAELYAGAAALAALWLLGRFVENRPLRELGIPGGRPVAGLLVGLAIGGMIAATTVGLLAVTGSYSYAGAGDLQGAPGNLTLLLVFELGSAALQAVLFFGIVFRELTEWLGRWLAIALSVVLFGALHLTAANASASSAVVIGLSGGALLALSYVVTRAVWLPMGVLWGLNVALAEVVGGIPASPHTLFHARISGSEIWTGGAAGIEAGFALLIPAAIAIAAMAWRTRAFARRDST